MRTAANSLAALIADASPLVIAVAAVWLFGERLGRWQVLGVLLGLAGMAIVVLADLSVQVAGSMGLAAAAIGLTGASLGTLHQKGASVDSDMLSERSPGATGQKRPLRPPPERLGG